MQTPLAQVGALQVPLLPQSNLQVEPALQSALGQIEPPDVHVKLHVAPASQVTCKALQLPALLHLKSQVLPAPHVA